MSAEITFTEANRRLLARCEEAVRTGARAQAEALLEELHWFAHDDPALHAAMHRLELAIARDEGDHGAALRALLPVAFASTIARLERLGRSAIVETHVEAPPELVYDVVADVARYREWNPWLVDARGSGARGGSVDAEVRLGARTVSAGHEVLVARRGERFAWRDTGWFTPLVRGRRLRTLLPEGRGTHLITKLLVVGPLTPLAWALYGEGMRDGLRAESDALKARAEALAGTTTREERIDA